MFIVLSWQLRYLMKLGVEFIFEKERIRQLNF